MPVFSDEIHSQLARLIHMHLVVMFSGYTGLTILMMFISPGPKYFWLGMIIVPLALNLALLILAKRRLLRLSGLIIVIELWLLITIYAFAPTGLGARAAWGFFIVVFDAGMLLGGMESIVAAVICSLTTLSIAFLPKVTSPHPWLFWLINTVYLLVMIFLQSLASGSIRELLAKTGSELRERLLAQAALFESERKHREMVNFLPFCVFEADLHGKLTFVNQTALDRFGYSKEEFLAGVNVLDIVVDVDKQRARESVRRIVSGEGVSFHEYLVKTKDGSLFTALIRTRRIFENGIPIGLQGSLIDISDRKQAEKEREQIISLLKATLESTTDAILVVDLAGRIAHYNRRFAEMWHIPDEVLADSEDEKALAFVCDQLVDPQGFISRVKQLYASPREESFDLLEFKDGRYFERYSRPQMLSGQPVGRVWSFRDISERKRSEEALLESELRYRTLFETASDSIFVMKGDLFFNCNSKTLEMFGCSREQIVGASPDQFSPPLQPDGRNSREKALEKIRAAYAGQPQFFEWTHVKGDRTPFIAEVSLSRIELSGASYLLAIVRDITGRRKLEDQLLQAQKMEAVGILAGGVAHDFNNILSTIVGYGSLLQMRMQTDPQLKEYIEKILDSCERAVRLTSSLLTFSRKQEIELHAVDINDAIFSFHKILARLIGEDIDLRIDLSSQSLVVDADVRQVEQVLMNLATNSRDAMPRGGRLTISTSAVDFNKDTGEIPRGSYAAISVADTGTGMEKDVQAHIFEPFFTTKEVGKGTGLGLAIVYGIVKKHGGFITVASAPGQGTAFTIYVPLKSLLKKEPRRRKAEKIPSGDETILLIEDDPAVRQVTRSILEEFGYKVLEAEDGEVAQEVFRRQQVHIHLVLCDLIMPRLNGRETLAAIQKIKPGTKAIFMSGYASDVIAGRGIADAGIHLLLKPLNPAILLKKIRAVLDER